MPEWNGPPGAASAADTPVVSEGHLSAGICPQRPGPAKSQVGHRSENLWLQKRDDFLQLMMHSETFFRVRHPDPHPDFSSINTSRPKVTGLILSRPFFSLSSLSFLYEKLVRAIVFFMLKPVITHSSCYLLHWNSAVGPLSLMEAEVFNQTMCKIFDRTTYWIFSGIFN